jgi:hypothetical protein
MTRQSRPISTKSSETIRQQVDIRHWQLFETRLKNSLTEPTRENYTKANDYRVIDRLKKVDRPQPPMEPDQRWQTFCSQLTTKSNEANRLISIFHNVWIKNWNTTQSLPDAGPISNENTFLQSLVSNERDKQVISSILHRPV